MNTPFVVSQPRSSILSLSHIEGAGTGLCVGGLGGVEVLDGWAIVFGALVLANYDELITMDIPLLTR